MKRLFIVFLLLSSFGSVAQDLVKFKTTGTYLRATNADNWIDFGIKGAEVYWDRAKGRIDILIKDAQYLNITDVLLTDAKDGYTIYVFACTNQKQEQKGVALTYDRNNVVNSIIVEKLFGMQCRFDLTLLN